MLDKQSFSLVPITLLPYTEFAEVQNIVFTLEKPPENSKMKLYKLCSSCHLSRQLRQLEETQKSNISPPFLPCRLSPVLHEHCYQTTNLICFKTDFNHFQYLLHKMHALDQNSSPIIVQASLPSLKAFIHAHVD